MGTCIATITSTADGYSISGSINFQSVMQLVDDSKQLITESNSIVRLDFSRVTNANSAAGTYLLEMFRHTNQQLSIIGLPDKLLTWLHMTGLTEILPINNT